MSIFIDKKTKVIVQGITGRDGSFHAAQMKQYGTNVVAGVTPGKGGSSVNGIPVFNSMAEAMKKVKANTCNICSASFCHRFNLRSDRLRNQIGRVYHRRCPG